MSPLFITTVGYGHNQENKNKYFFYLLRTGYGICYIKVSKELVRSVFSMG